jgi:hypothetical protein
MLISLTLAYFAHASQVHATCQDGCDSFTMNTFLGEDALLNDKGCCNTAVGWNALTNNGNASWNTAVGSGALEFNQSGFDNTAIGVTALELNQSGSSNTAIGRDALLGNQRGSSNTATGASALLRNNSGNANVANGAFALNGNTGGGKNVAIGYEALLSNTSSQSNVAVGYQAGLNTTGSNNIVIGNKGVVTEANTIRIGSTSQTNTYIAGINGVTLAGGIGVIVDSSGHLGTSTCSAGYKENIKPMAKASEAILALKPVTFRYKHELDPEGIPQFGLVAEQVEKVNPDLVARDEQGKPYSVRYEAVNAMLLNEFLKEHRAFLQEQHKVENLEATLTQQRKEFEAAVVELKGQIQKVSTDLELAKSAPQTVSNN